MPTNSENSALTALSELRNLEADRVATEDSERRAREEADRRARADAERRARDEAERIARLQAEENARQMAEREAREREERIRVSEAEVRARAESEGRLREEQLRLDAQMKLAEKKARPKWPLMVVPVLVAGVGFAGYLAWDNQRKADVEAQRSADQKAEHEAALAAITEKLNALENEQKKLETDKAELDKKLGQATTDAERAKLLAEKQELERKLDANAEQQDVTADQGGVKREKKKKSGSSSSSSSSKEEKPDAPPPGRKDKIDLGESDDPLSGLK